VAPNHQPPTAEPIAVDPQTPLMGPDPDQLSRRPRSGLPRVANCVRRSCQQLLEEAVRRGPRQRLELRPEPPFHFPPSDLPPSFPPHALGICRRRRRRGSARRSGAIRATRRALIRPRFDIRTTREIRASGLATQVMRSWTFSRFRPELEIGFVFSRVKSRCDSIF
jgi:hypothetical protein